jgi:photosystem II stability/assembly factor-like uncharacterized protein
MKEASIFKDLKWVNHGPYSVGGRINDIEGSLKNPGKYFVASATGGLWVTEDNGSSWNPIFDHESSIAIGDIAIFNGHKQLIWVGTGENHSSRRAYAGTGVFMSDDGGKTWQHKGLSDTHHISRIVLDPFHQDTVYVAAMGHLFTKNEERGVFKTTDGGKSWEKLLFINQGTGIIDLVMHPKNPNILYAAAWEMERKPWNLQESGEGSAIYKTIDGGLNWFKIVKGFPHNRHVGRIGLAISSSNPKILYACVDNQQPRVIKEIQKKSGLSFSQLMNMNSQEFIKIKNEKLEKFLRENSAPKFYTAKIVKGLVQSGQITPKRFTQMIYETIEMFNTMVVGAEVYKSINEGESWFKTHDFPLPSELYFTYGFFFGQIRVCPQDEDLVYLLGVNVLKSTDGGKTFSDITSPKVHVDSHAMWIDPTRPERILLGTDGGLYISQNSGVNWQHTTNLPLAQCYTVNFDNQTPYQIYVGLQDNGVVMRPRHSSSSKEVHKWRMILDADGAYVEVDKDNPDTIYAAAQFGNIFRIHLNKNKRISIKPQTDSIKSGYRFNWLSPFIVSRHNPAKLLMGTNKMLESINRGATWTELSPDLSRRNSLQGNVPYATITTIDQSRYAEDIIYAGTDDGNVWLTINKGQVWKKISSVLPQKWVSRVIASAHKKERVYVCKTGYREDDFGTYVYVSHDFGRNWDSLKSNLPDEPVNVIQEDPLDGDILYLGTDLGIYISSDMGESWHSLKNNLPTTPVHDIKIHPQEHELIIATHGRGVYILSTKKIKKILSKAIP